MLHETRPHNHKLTCAATFHMCIDGHTPPTAACYDEGNHTSSPAVLTRFASGVSLERDRLFIWRQKACTQGSKACHRQHPVAASGPQEHSRLFVKPCTKSLLPPSSPQMGRFPLLVRLSAPNPIHVQVCPLPGFSPSFNRIFCLK